MFFCNLNALQNSSVVKYEVCTNVFAFFTVYGDDTNSNIKMK